MQKQIRALNADACFREQIRFPCSPFLLVSHQLLLFLFVLHLSLASSGPVGGRAAERLRGWDSTVFNSISRYFNETSQLESKHLTKPHTSTMFLLILYEFLNNDIWGLRLWGWAVVPGVELVMRSCTLSGARPWHSFSFRALLVLFLWAGELVTGWGRFAVSALCMMPAGLSAGVAQVATGWESRNAIRGKYKILMPWKGMKCKIIKGFKDSRLRVADFHLQKHRETLVQTFWLENTARTWQT